MMGVSVIQTHFDASPISWPITKMQKIVKYLHRVHCRFYFIYAETNF